LAGGGRSLGVAAGRVSWPRLGDWVPRLDDGAALGCENPPLAAGPCLE
jgi:hypothetical protein